MDSSAHAVLALRLGVDAGKSSVIATFCHGLGQQLSTGMITNDIDTDGNALILRAADVLHLSAHMNRDVVARLFPDEGVAGAGASVPG